MSFIFLSRVAVEWELTPLKTAGVAASAELPDAMELIYQTALAIGKGGAVLEHLHLNFV